ncbi:MAG TPA: DUF4190 domain-containing protein [Pseudonocardiaceae bacterium]|nr:DUF4190 domain-containing protein [Pseudonocardiaceae bacterium]
MTHSSQTQPEQQALPHFYIPVPPTNAMAILALVFAFLFFPLGIAFGHVAHYQIRRTREEGRGLATAGLVISYFWLGLILLFFGLAFVAQLSTS